MLPDDLKATVSGVLHRVRREAESVRYPGVQLPGHTARFSLVAEPLRDVHGSVTHVLVALGDAEGASHTTALIPPFADVPTSRAESEADAGTAAPADGLSRDRILALEEELTYAKEHLQSAIEEYETSNEELQATNEELIASNEELQSTNEDLHSVNEELYTVNAEYQGKHGQDADIQAAHEAGVDEHVTKPPDPARLERLLGRGESAAETRAPREADGDVQEAAGG